MRKPLVLFFAFNYKYILRPVIFLFDSERVHDLFTSFGKFLGQSPFNAFIKFIFYKKDDSLSQKLFGIDFENPIGLSAGFDYKVKLVDILPSLNFGFETIGTITNLPYDGNPKPRLGRLVRTKSLMVNKGFKNEGIKKIIEKLKGRKFQIPVGISIGKTNTTKITTQNQAVDDIIAAFKKAENSKVDIRYYELNISCPNLFGNIEFYKPQHLEDLLKAVFSLNLSKPVFVKMPILKSNEKVIQMMNVIIQYPVKAVIFGNLQMDRKDESFIKQELAKFPIGNFSGRPTEKRSNELIELVYKNYGNKIKIIGCGGVFSAKQAYAKIKLGASLVQLITGLVFEGPQLAAQINLELSGLIKKDGFTNISQAIGKDLK